MTLEEIKADCERVRKIRKQNVERMIVQREKEKMIKRKKNEISQRGSQPA